MKTKLLTEDDKQRLSDAVKKAEEKTSGEIVPMIVKQSDLYPAAHFRLAILVSLTVSMIMYYLPYEYDVVWYLWAQLPGLVLGYVLAFNPTIKRWFSTRAEISEEVRQRAIEAFFMNELHHTKERTGILIMVSLLEKRIEVLADSGINQKVEKSTWNNLVKPLGKSIKQGHLVDGLIHSIEEAGALLATHFPGNHNDTNELSNEVVTDH